MVSSTRKSLVKLGKSIINKTIMNRQYTTENAKRINHLSQVMLLTLGKDLPRSHFAGQYLP